jgi:hypothetical protein
MRGSGTASIARESTALSMHGRRINPDQKWLMFLCVSLTMSACYFGFRLSIQRSNAATEYPRSAFVPWDGTSVDTQTWKRTCFLISSALPHRTRVSLRSGQYQATACEIQASALIQIGEPEGIARPSICANPFHTGKPIPAPNTAPYSVLFRICPKSPTHE